MNSAEEFLIRHKMNPELICPARCAEQNLLCRFLIILLIVIMLLSFSVIPAQSAFAEDEIPEDWFDDALFIGDSITGSLCNKVLMDGGLGQAQILYVNGLSCHGIIRDNRTIPYMGNGLAISEILQKSKANKLFLMLAMNDIGQKDEVLVESWTKLISNIREKCPDVKIFIQSGTPLFFEHDWFTNANMTAYNELLQNLCEELDCVYVDVTAGLAGADGCMLEEYHLDSLHLTIAACEIWIKNLKEPANYSADIMEGNND